MRIIHITLKVLLYIFVLCWLCIIKRMSCCIKSCKNVRRLQSLESSITFHRIPKANFKQYMEILGMSAEYSLYEIMYICSEHFKDEDTLISENSKKKFLKEGVLPCKNLLSVEIKYSTSSSDDDIIQPQPGPSGIVKTTTKIKDGISTLTISRSSSSVGSVREKAVKSSEFQKASRKRKVPTNQKENTERSSLEAAVISSFSSSTSTSTKHRRQTTFIRSIHSYNISPRKQKRKLVESRKRGIRSSKKLYLARRKISTLKQQISSLHEIIAALKNKQMLSPSALDYLTRTVEEIPRDLFERYFKNVELDTVTREEYLSSLRNFAITLQFYSSKAYEYVRKTFAFALPHASTIRNWYSAGNCEPGFQSECFIVLQQKTEKGESLICSMLMDEMAIKKAIEFDGQRMWGYEDMGVEMDDDDLEEAGEVLVLMVVSCNQSWKLPIAYFFIKSLTGKEKANIICEALIRLANVGVRITSLTCDGPSTHFTMFAELGCDFSDIANLKTHFKHPATGEKGYAIFDACHMIKLIRNNLATSKSFFTDQNKEISWKYIEALYNLQESLSLRFGNKLSKAHIEWNRQKMKVSLAVQTISASVGEALKFLREDIKHTEFINAEPTEGFIFTVNNVFDIFNSMNPFGRGFKSALHMDNQFIWKNYLIKTKSMFSSLKLPNGVLLHTSRKKTPFLGLCINISSLLGIFEDYVATNKLKYLLTYKLSQDHLEMFFCCVRSRNGWNNNLTCWQFRNSFRRLLLHANVEGRTGNCRVLDTTCILNSTMGNGEVLNKDVSTNRAFNLNVEELQDHDYDMLPINLSLNSLEENVVTYISGYVVKMVLRSIDCSECIEALYDHNEAHSDQYKFLLRKNKGGLIVPSLGVTKICMISEKAL